MDCPTRSGFSRRPAPGRPARKKAAIDGSRVNPAPEIYVRVEGRAYWKTSYARAHLRNKKGYVYLVWRDGERIREFYLGKAPRKSPTLEVESPGARPAAAELAAGGGRRGKSSPKGVKQATEKLEGLQRSSLL